VASLIVLSAVAIAIYIASDLNSGWLLASKSYGDLGMPEYGGLARLLVYATSALMAMSILAWVPQQKLRMTDLGRRTLYVYLLHGVFIQYFRDVDLFKMERIIVLFGLAVVSAAIVLVISRKPMLGLWQPFIEGKASSSKKAWIRRISPKDTQPE